METRSNLNPKGCLARALPDEPLAVFLARDPDAPAAFKAWGIARATRLGISRDDPEVAWAIDNIAAFTDWREKNDGKWREGKTTPAEQPSEEMTSLAGKVLAAENPMSGDPAALEQLIADAKSLAGAVLRLDHKAGQGGD